MNILYIYGDDTEIMHRKALEINLYVAGAGAFGVFLRWLQDQLAFNELGLADPSVFHALLPLFLLAAAAVFLHFIDRMEKERQELPEDFCEALHNEGRLFAFARRALGVIMVLGALLLLAEGEVDKYPGMVRAVAILGAVSGVAYPLMLAQANREQQKPWLNALLALQPVLLFAVWLVTSYRQNSINPVLWACAMDIFTPITAMVTFFRLAGFAFGAARPRRSFFAAMFGAVMCLTALADSRYMGMQLMLVAAAGMLILTNWIMVVNLRTGKPREKRPAQPDGFERL